MTVEVDYFFSRLIQRLTIFPSQTLKLLIVKIHEIDADC